MHDEEAFGEFKIDFQRMIGQGAFATAYLCTRKGDKETYVAKRIVIKPEYKNVIEREKKNSEILMEKHHENVIRVEDTEKKDNLLFVYTKFYKEGTLDKLLKKKGILRPDEIKDMYIGIASGLDFLHSNKIVHRDMKDENIFLEEIEGGGIRPVIGDLGFARNIEVDMDTIIGTPITMSPELLNYDTYSSSVDIWAFGSILYKMCFGIYPFEKGDLRAAINTGTYILNKNVLASVSSLKIIAKCLMKDEKKRPVTKDLLKEDLFTKPFSELTLVWIVKNIKLDITHNVKELEAYLENEKYCLKIKPSDATS